MWILSPSSKLRLRVSSLSDTEATSLKVKMEHLLILSPSNSNVVDSGWRSTFHDNSDFVVYALYIHISLSYQQYLSKQRLLFFIADSNQFATM